MRTALAILIFLTPQEAFPYIDPGTGSLVYGLLAWFAAGFLAFWVFAWRFMRTGARAVWGFARHRKGLAALATGSVVAGMVLAWAFRPYGSKNMASKTNAGTKYERLIMLGFDGFDHRIVSRLLKEGALPHFARLSERGTFAPLAPPMPPESPVSWASIATGENPGEHNLFDFIHHDRKTYVPHLSLLKEKAIPAVGNRYETVIQATPFWRTTSRSNIPTSVIRWPLTFPAEEVRGKMLGGLGIPEIHGLMNKYTFYTSSDDSGNSGEEKTLEVLVDERGLIRTEIRGPRKQGAFRTTEISVPLTIELHPDQEKAVLLLDGKRHEVKSRGWSDWMRVSFRTGIMGRVSAIFKVYLESIGPEFRMYMTSLHFDPREPAFPLTYPSDYAKELSDAIGLYYTLGMPEDTQALNDGKISDETFLQQCEDITAQREKMFWHEFDKHERGLLAFVFDTSDRIQHMFWRNNEMDADFNIVRLAPEIRAHYIRMDAIIGKVLGRVDDKTAVIAISDHGFTSFDVQVDVNRWLFENGFMFFSKEPDESTWGALFRTVDWSSTRAFAAGFTSVYLNLAGREAQGIVRADEADEVLSRITQGLEGLRDANGKRVVNKVYRGRDLYHGRFEKNAPDLVLGFMPGYRMSWQTAIGGAFRTTLAPNTKKWRGDHLVDSIFVPGVYFSSFETRKSDLQVTDVASIALDALGVRGGDEK